MSLGFEEIARATGQNDLDALRPSCFDYPANALLVVFRLKKANVSMTGNLRPFLAMRSKDLYVRRKRFTNTQNNVALAGYSFKKPDQMCTP